MVEPYTFFMRSQPSNHPLVYVWWHVFSFFVPLLNLLRGTVEILTGRDHLTPERLLAPAQLALLLWAWGYVWGGVLWLIIHGVAVYLLIVVSTPVHRSKYSWTEGCQAAGVPAAGDFGHHTVISTADYSVGEGNAGLVANLFAYAAFNDHVVHHLFPTVDASRQHLIRGVFLEQCKAFGIPYRRQTFAQLLSGTFAAMVRPVGSLVYHPHDVPGEVIPAK